jgi:DNA-binding SARP family transcriptional activator
MSHSPSSGAPGFYLVTLGTPALVEHGTPIQLRKKDLALLVYLRLEGKHGHSRGALAGLLWGNSREENARHSLTQAIGRLRARLGSEVLQVGHDRVGCSATLDCDAAALQLAAGSDRVDESILSLCAGDFLAGFQAGPGAEAFESWADGRRAHLRIVAVAALERLGAEAEARGDWDRALAAGQRAVDLDPASEPGHRRVMRAWNALGHRVRALQHYERLAEWVSAEFETDPEPETADLAEQLRCRTPRPPRPAPEPVPSVAARPFPAAPREPSPFPPAAPALPPLVLPAEPVEAAVEVESVTAAAGAADPFPDPPSRVPAPHWAWGGVAGLAVLLAVLWSAGVLVGGGWRPQAEGMEAEGMNGPSVPRPPLAAPEAPVTRMEDWLRTDGRWIFYRYGTYLPGACGQPTRAVGNWGRDGRREGDAVLCIDRAWMAVDVERLGRRFELSPGTTYCLSFVYAAGDTLRRGEHGARAAPGLDSIRVPAANGVHAIGFAMVREPGGRRVRLTNAYPGPPC